MPRSSKKREMLVEFMERQESKCLYCGQPCFIGTIQERIDKDRYHNIATIEHLLPQGMPKRNHFENLAMACNKCNHERSILWQT